MTLLSTLFANAAGSAGFWMPRQASETAKSLDAVFFYIYYLSAFFFFAIIGATFYFAVKYRRKHPKQKTSPLHHSNTLEFWWTLIPTILLVSIFLWGFRAWVEISIPPPNSLEINVTARKWGWNFTYPRQGFDQANLVVPEKTPIKLIMSSIDVIHSFYLPEFRLKRDVLPGRYTVLWFNALQKGTYNIYCTEYCGTGHSKMMNRLIVKTQAEYGAWLQVEAKKFEDEKRKSPAKYGESLYAGKGGCKACHSADGSRVIGPSFKGIFGKEVAFADGSKQKRDENYLRRSILNPNGQIVAGYPANQMPTYQGQLSEEEIGALIAYIKSLAP